jgi:hypothetical protein
MKQLKRFKFRWIAIPAVFFFGFFVWTTDRVTLQGERTVYTVSCLHGTWTGNRCSGELATGPRVRYRALKIRGEVLFWVLGSTEPSAKLTACDIQDGRNWTCPESADAPKSLTLAMAKGEPLRNPAWSTRPFHSTSKVGWMLLNSGIKFPDFVE